MKITTLLVTLYLCLSGSFVFSVKDESFTFSSNKELETLNTTRKAYGYYNDDSAKMCQLCTKEMAEGKEWKSRKMKKEVKKCYSGGDYHEFHNNNWAVSILPPNNKYEMCYIDIFPPKDPFNTDPVKQEERLYITGDCEKGKTECLSVHHRFKISKQLGVHKYSYQITRQNQSGKVKYHSSTIPSFITLKTFN